MAEHCVVSLPVTTRKHPLGVKLPFDGVAVNMTRPDGAVLIPGLTSLTVAVHVVDPPAGNVDGVQTTVVVVVRGAAEAVVTPWLAE